MRASLNAPHTNKKDKVISVLNYVTKHYAMKVYGGVEVWLHHLDLDTRWRWSGQLHGPAPLPPGTESPPVPVV
jgi:hypothetical protein